MKTSFVSNLAVTNAMRLTIQRSQQEVVKLQEEATTGTYADSGTALGSSSSRAVDLKNEMDRLSNLKDTNSIVTQRLSTSQLALETMRKAAEQMNSTLVNAMGSDDVTQLNIAHTTNVGSLSAFTAAANAQFNGEYLLAGVNSDAVPLDPYTDTSAAKASFDSALKGFMTSNNIASMKDFTSDQMNTFITETLEPMYTGDQWKTDWSNASDANVVSRISAGEVVTSTTNANANGVRKFALAAVISTELLGADVPSDVRSTINTAAQGYIQQSISGMIDQSSTLGLSEARVKKANTSIDSQVKLINTHVADLEGVDPYEATTRLKALMTQIETSYTLTSRMQQLSLINFL